MRAFDLPDLQGDRWNLTPGFKGLIGLGLTSYEGDTGTYRIAGWGDDIFGTADQAHFAYRSITGDGEMVVRANSIGDTNTWAHYGVYGLLRHRRHQPHRGRAGLEPSRAATGDRFYRIDHRS